MSEILGKKLVTPNELANANVGLSLVQQWKMRRDSRLKFIRMGGRIFYLPEHLEQFFAECEVVGEVTAQSAA